MDVQPCGAGTSPVRVTAGWSSRLCRQSAVVWQEDGKKACQCLCLFRLCRARGPSHAQTWGDGAEWKRRSREMSRSEEKGWCWGLGSQQGAVGSEGWMNLLSEYVDGLALEQRSGLPRRCLCVLLLNTLGTVVCPRWFQHCWEVKKEGTV